MWNYWSDSLVSAQKELAKDHSPVSYFLSFHINWISKDLVSITFEDSAYVGGAHSMPYIRVLNYDLKRKRTIRLADLFKKGVDYKSQINKEVKEYFKDAPLIEEFVTIKEDDQFAITPTGIEIIFQVYEYTPYSYGFPEIFIPYSKLKGLEDWLLDAIKKVSSSE